MRGTPSAVGDGHRAGPRRVEPGQAGQVRRAPAVRVGVRRVGGLAVTSVISRAQAFSPDPMPMSSTRSPASRSSLAPASVNGTEQGPMLPKVGKVRGHPVGVDAQALADRVGVHLGDLVDDVAVHPLVPAELLRRLGPQVLGQVQPGVQQALEVGDHHVVVADAQLVVLGGRAAHGGDDPVTLGVPVGATEDHRGGAGAEGERRELGDHVARGVARRGEPGDGGLLHRRASPRRRRRGRSRPRPRRSWPRRSRCR